MAHACNPSTPEAEEGGSRVQGQPELHSKILCLTNKIKQNKSKGNLSPYSRRLKQKLHFNRVPGSLCTYYSFRSLR
jgi:hypothetical protein